MIIKNVFSESEAEQKHSKSYTNIRKHIDFVLKHAESEVASPINIIFSLFERIVVYLKSPRRRRQKNKYIRKP